MGYLLWVEDVVVEDAYAQDGGYRTVQYCMRHGVVLEKKVMEEHGGQLRASKR